MTEIDHFTSQIPDFYKKSAVDQLVVLAWFLEVRRGKSILTAADLRACFRDAGLEPPEMSVYLPRLSKKKPPQLIRTAKGYRLSANVRRELDGTFSGDSVKNYISKTLEDLPSRLSSNDESTFLAETLNCYRAGAYRATVVMMWILAYDHFVTWAFSDAMRIANLNVGLASRYTKKQLTLAKREDAEELKESEFIEVARTGKVIDKNTCQILKEKLARRNMAAHPSQIVISQHSADEMIMDLIENVVIKMK